MLPANLVLAAYGLHYGVYIMGHVGVGTIGETRGGDNEGPKGHDRPNDGNNQIIKY